MRYIPIPPPMLLGADKAEFPIGAFVAWLLDHAARAEGKPALLRFGTTGTEIRRAARIERAFAEADGYASLDDPDWQELAEAVEHPFCEWPVTPSRRLAAFVIAITDARSERP